MPGRDDLIQQNRSRATAPQSQPTAPGVPNPDATQTSPKNGYPITTPGQSQSPRPVSADIESFSGPGHTVKSALLKPALTSHFQCWFNPPQAVRRKTNYNGNEEFFSLSCTEASLPGSSILTNEINDDYTGVTERIGYRRQYDNVADFTFLVDAGAIGSGYNVIRFFEEWIRHSMGETSFAPDSEYFYRVRFPDGANGYRTEIFLNKFEKDYNGSYLQYTFVRAYPISISSMPVSYESSQLLKCTVSFTYNRYVLNDVGYSGENSEPKQPTATGVPEFYGPGLPGEAANELRKGYLQDLLVRYQNIPGFNPEAFNLPILQ